MTILMNVSVDDLVLAKENAASITKQFPLRPAKVNSIVKSIKTHNQFLSVFSIAKLVDEDTLYLVGGRHRLQALLNIIRDDNDSLVLESCSEDANFPAVVHEVESTADIVLLTQFDNDSRAMQPAEKQYLGFTFDVQLEGDDYAVTNISKLRTAYLYLDITHPTLNLNTVRQVWSATITGLNKDEKKVLTTNEQALRAFGSSFQQLLVPAAKETRTPARDYKKVASLVLPKLLVLLGDFKVVAKQHLTKKDKEDVAILGRALERSLNSDKIDEVRGVPKLVRRSEERQVFDLVAADAELAANEEAPF